MEIVGRVAKTRVVTSREELHDMIDRLPDAALDVARAAFVSVESSPLLTTIDDAENAPLDDEPVTNDDLAAMRDAEERRDYAPFSEVRERLERLASLP